MFGPLRRCLPCQVRGSVPSPVLGHDWAPPIRSALPRGFCQWGPFLEPNSEPVLILSWVLGGPLARVLGSSSAVLDALKTEKKASMRNSSREQ